MENKKLLKNLLHGNDKREQKSNLYLMIDINVKLIE